MRQSLRAIHGLLLFAQRSSLRAVEGLALIAPRAARLRLASS
jgi:hypothetical protein